MSDGNHDRESRADRSVAGLDAFGRMIGMETTATATGTFEIDSWNDEVYDDGADVKLSRVHLAKTFAGDRSA